MYGYQKIPFLTMPALKAITKIATQTEVDKVRFIAIGADSKKVENLGNIKFDIIISNEILLEGQILKINFSHNVLFS